MSNGSVPAYYVDPANTTQINRYDLAGKSLFTGGDDRAAYFLPRFNPMWPSDPQVVTYNPTFAEDVYEAILATYALPREYYGTPIVAFEGAVNTATGRVRETAAEVSLLTLYNIKVAELTQYATFVFDSPFPATWGARNYWLINSELARDARGTYNGHLGVKAGVIQADAVQAGIDAGGGTNAEVAAWWANIKARQSGPDPWWARDIKVFAYLDNEGQPDDLKQITDTANQAQWYEITLAEGTFNWQVRNANDRVQQDINTAYGDGSGVPGGTEWNTLAAIDVDAASYNWPRHYVGPPELGTTGPGV